MLIYFYKGSTRWGTLSRNNIANDNYILVVDDTPTNIFIIKLILEESGFRLDVATNGLEAVNKFQPGKYRAILMDIQMPVMDGYQACSEIRRIEAQNLFSQTPIIIITANPLYEVEEKVIDLSIKHIFTKPIAYEDLVQKIKQLAA